MRSSHSLYYKKKTVIATVWFMYSHTLLSVKNALPRNATASDLVGSEIASSVKTQVTGGCMQGLKQHTKFQHTRTVYMARRMERKKQGHQDSQLEGEAGFPEYTINLKHHRCLVLNDP